MNRKHLLRGALAAVAALATIGLGGFAAPEKFPSAVFAGGCFWTMEHDFELLPGVVKVVSGYSGGRESHPTYEEVSGETTGHLEAVRVTWDPSKTNYATLVNRYWRMIDPTDAAGQVCDRAPSYHSAIFVDSPQERRIAEQSLAAIDKGPLKGRIATQIRPAMTFWPAEAYHQGYATTHALDYALYRRGCGRDVRLKQIWGDDAEPVASERRLHR
jgi:peptide-methionine (S)-S-oxide reductase